MEMYFFNPQEWDRLYVNGCRHYDIDLHPLEERKHVLVGWSFIFQFVFYYILYIPCIFAIWKHMKQSCYKLMFVIGIADCLCIIVNALFAGYFSITGQVFCSNPHLHYWVGLLGLGLEIYSSKANALGYGLFQLRSIPYITVHSLNPLYSVLTFLQVLAISFFNGYAAGLYVYLQYVPVTQFLLYTASYSWTTAHGLPCVIYILLNKTIRDDLIKMCKGSFKLNRSQVNSSTAKVAPIAIQSISKGTMNHK
ncbi:serpentine type 7TM GPCR chemoreceptor srt domain-containing protein [Ditylenchus destructor]|nr:serpentine type 7TM GPCR chemoreceptor srt domain-containing protein [Ditylenchus destructor]